MAETQELITDLRIRDNLTVGLAKAKAGVNDFGNAAEGSAKRASNAFDKLGADIKKGIGLGLGLGVTQLVAQGVREVVGFLGDITKAAADDEVSIVRLTQALKENVPAWDGQTIAIEKAIGAAARLGFADDEVRGSITILSAATKDLGQALQIQSTAMDLARFKNISLAEASEALVKVEAGSFRILKSLGIELKEGATQTEALAAVQKLAAGQAEVFGKTNAGAAKEASVAFDEAAESIGKGLLPVITEAAHFSRDVLAPALKSVGDNMDKIVPAAGALALIIGGKLALGLAASVKGLIASGIAAVQAADAATVLALAQEREAIAANLAAAAQERLNLARAGGAGAAGAGVAGAAASEAVAVGTAAKAAGADAAAGAAGVGSFTAGLKALVSSGLASVGMFNTLHEAMVQDGTDTQAGVIAKLRLAQGLDAQGKATTEVTTDLVAASVAMSDYNRETTLTAEAARTLAQTLKETLPTLGSVKTGMLGAGVGTDTLSDSLLRGANAATIAAAGYGLAADQIDRLRSTAGKPFVVPPTIKIPGLESEGLTGVPRDRGVTGPDSFLADLDQDQRNRDEAARREQERLAELKRRQSEAEAARDKALSEAKAKAQERYNRTLANTKDIATTLFDAQHARALRAIKDTETLAQKQHDGALQQISDALKVRLEQNAAPVTAAEERQRQIDLARQRRDLNESRAAAEASGDPEAIRSAVEAQQSFEANQRINALRLEQAKLDAQAQEEARSKQKAADDQLAAAKIASAKDIEAESLRNKTQRARFDKELEALKRRDAGASPAKVAKDIAALEEKFGITTDVKGFHHIEDLAAVAKDLKPTFTGIGDAAAVATPGLAAVGASATAAASGLAVFIKSLGELKVLELPIPKPVEPLDIRQPATALDQPRLSEAEILASAIKNLQIPPPIFNPTINVYVAGSTLNGRLVGAAMASSQSPSATPGIRNGSVSPRP